MRTLLQHDVAVGPTDPERAHARDQRAILVRPVPELGVDAQAELAERDLWVGRLVVEARRQLAVVDRERGLDQPDDAGGALEVADVRLRRADQKRIAGRPRHPERGPERRGLDRIAAARPGAVELDVLHVPARDPRPPTGEPDHLGLRHLARHRESLARPVVVDGSTADRAVDVVAVGDRVGQRLERDDGAALSLDEAVGAGVEGVAAPVGGQAAEARGREGALAQQVEVDAGGQRKPRLPPAQALARELDRDEPGGLAGVDDEARAAQPEQVRDSVGDDAPLRPGERVPGDRCAAPLLKLLIVAGDRTDEHPGRLALERPRQDARVLQRLPAQLEHQPLLGVHRRRLARRDLEEPRVEAVDGVEEAAVADSGVGIALCRAAGRPAVRRRLGDRAPTVAEELPEGLWIRGSGKPAGDADDRDRRAVSHGLHPPSKGQSKAVYALWNSARPRESEQFLRGARRLPRQRRCHDEFL